MEVKTVTAIIRGLLFLLAIASAAAAIIRSPPEAWTFTIHTPSSAAAATAPAQVLGISWNFKSKKTSKFSLCSCSIIAGPDAVKSSFPTFTRHLAGSSCLAISIAC